MGHSAVVILAHFRIILDNFYLYLRIYETNYVLWHSKSVHSFFYINSDRLESVCVLKSDEKHEYSIFLVDFSPFQGNAWVGTRRSLSTLIFLLYIFVLGPMATF